MADIPPLILPDGYPELLEHIAQRLYREMCERGSAPGVAAEIALAAADAISDDFGGNQIYIPMSQSTRVSERHMEIYRTFDGHNFREIVRRFNISEMHARRIINRVREVERKKRQRPLF